MSEGRIVRVPKDELKDDDRRALFAMYEKTYTSAGQDLWFKTADDLFGYQRYKCIVTLDSPNNMRKAYILFQFKPKYNKISLVCQDGTPEGKALALDILKTLLLLPGYCLEASGAVSWVLRKANIPRIEDKSQIEEALDITPGNNYDYIEMNPDFSPDVRTSQSYTRHYTDPKTNKTYTTSDTLFGAAGCEYPSIDDCSRNCSVKQGATRRRRRRRTARVRTQTRNVRRVQRQQLRRR